MNVCYYDRHCFKVKLLSSHSLSTLQSLLHCLLQLDNRRNVCQAEAQVGRKNSHELRQQRVNVDLVFVIDQSKCVVVMPRLDDSYVREMKSDKDHKITTCWESQCLYWALVS